MTQFLVGIVERNDKRVVRWMSKFRPEDKISEEESQAMLPRKYKTHCIYEKKKKNLEQKELMWYILIYGIY